MMGIRQRACRGRMWRRSTMFSAMIAAAMAGLGVASSNAAAQGRFTPRLSLDAFGTFGLAYSSEGRADYVENVMQPDGPGHSHGLDARLDSRIAGQASAFLGAKISAVVQIMAEQNFDHGYEPHVEWAYVGYAIASDLKIRGGRIVFPAFMVSDARKVSYANPWLRPPIELYGMVPVYFVDGVDVTYSRHLGDWTGRLNVVFGRTESDFPSGKVEADHSWTANATITRGSLTARLAMAQAKVQFEMFGPLFDGFRMFGPQGEAIADRFDVDNRTSTFLAGGAEFAPGSWFTMLELGWYDSNSALGERMGGHLTTGVRWGEFTSYVTYSRTGLLSETSVDGLPIDGLPPNLAAVATQLNAGLNDLLSAPPVQQNFAFGGRWDVRPGIALKAQLDFVDLLQQSHGTFVNLQPGFEPGGAARVFSIATAFVF